MFDYYTAERSLKSRWAYVISFLRRNRLFLVLIVLSWFLYQGLHYLSFARAAWSSIDTIVESSYAPRFDLQLISNGQWSLEKKRQIEDSWYNGTSEDKDIFHQRAQEVLRAENSNTKPDLSKYPEPTRHQLPKSDFSLRREQDGSGALLLKCNYTNIVFSYNPAAREMTLSSNEKWNSSTGEITEGGKDLNFGSINQSNQENRNGSSTCGANYECLSRQVSTVGHIGWGRIFSPDYLRIIVLSIDGPASGGGGFMTGPPMIRGGLRYLEMFEISETKSSSQPRFKKVGKTIMLFDPKESKKISLAWMPDNQFVIAFTDDNSVVSIIDVKDFSKSESKARAAFE